MSIGVSLVILFEALIAIAIIYGIANEKKWIMAEYRLNIRKLKPNEDIIYIRRGRQNKYK